MQKTLNNKKKKPHNFEPFMNIMLKLRRAAYHRRSCSLVICFLGGFFCLFVFVLKHILLAIKILYEILRHQPIFSVTGRFFYSLNSTIIF